MQEILGLEARAKATPRAVVLGALLCTLRPPQGHTTESQRLLARLYESAGLPWLAADCCEDAGDFQAALAIAIELDDQVRVRRFLVSLKTATTDGSKDAAVPVLDETLVAHACAVLAGDLEWLDAMSLARSGRHWAGGVQLV